MQRAASKKKRKMDAKREQRVQKQKLSANTAASLQDNTDESDAEGEEVDTTLPTVADASSVAASSATSATRSSAPFTRLKPGSFSRLLYTNPVCLLTSSARPAATVSNTNVNTSDQPMSDASAASSATSTPSRNIMTISWLTATSNHGEFMMSMNSSRYTARLLHRAGDKFVLNVPVKGMEEVVKKIGACSGGDVGEKRKEEGKESAAATSAAEAAISTTATAASSSSSSAPQDKFSHLHLSTCRPGNKPLFTSEPSQHPHKYTKPPPPNTPDALDAKDDEMYHLTAIPECVAHMVCEVTAVLLDAPNAGDAAAASASSASSPLPAAAASSSSTTLSSSPVRGHNILFCRITRAYVHPDYWNVQHQNFIPVSVRLPPYLTFLGSGSFAYVTK